MHPVRRLTLLIGIILLASPFIFIDCGKQKRIQVILISIDTLRGDHITPYGYSRDTSPNLAKLVEDSVYYKNAYTNGCWTMPSHISLLTGTLPSRHGVNQDYVLFIKNKYPRLKDSIKTISEVLKSRDKNIKTLKFAQLSDSIGFNRGFDINRNIDPFTGNEKFAGLMKEIENHKAENFFLFIHTWMVHAPYTHSYFLADEKIPGKTREYIDNFRKLSKEEKVKLLGKNQKGTGFPYFLRVNRLFNAIDCQALYDSGIHYVDRCIGEIIKKSRQLGIYDNLLFIVVSDHGEHFGERSKYMFYDHHGHDFYEEYIKVPLIVKYPHHSKRNVIDRPVSLIDVVPTILDYYKIEIPGFVQGESLLIPESSRKRKYFISEALIEAGMEKKMIRVGDLKYIITMNNPGKPGRINWDEVSERRLFDLESDPPEKINLFNRKKYKPTGYGLEKMLRLILENSANTLDSTKLATIEKETLEHMKSLGYF